MRLHLISPSSLLPAEQYPVLLKKLDTLLDEGGELSLSEACQNPMLSAERAQVLLEAMLSERYDVLWTIRGGEGCADCMPLIHAHREELLKIPPKRIIGMSDLTPLLNYAAQQLNWPTCHAPCANGLLFNPALDAVSLTQLKAWLKADQKASLLDGLLPMNPAAKNAASITGKLVGGNMTLLTLAQGDIWQPNFNQSILFIEDWHEAAYRVDRALKYFARLGWFDQCQACVLGDFESGQFSDDVQINARYIADLKARVQQFCESQSCPIFSSSQFGHGSVNHALPYHLPLTLHEGRLEVSDA